MSQNKPALTLFSLINCILILLLSQGVAFGGQLAPSIGLSQNTLSSDTIPGNCPRNDEIEKIINEASSLGAPVYNAGMHIACYRIYEWAAYKILFVFGQGCAE